MSLAPPIKEIETVCAICGKPLFLTVPADLDRSLFAGLLGQSVHQACYEDRDAKAKAREGALAMMAQQTVWHGICPQEFRQRCDFKMLNCSRKKYDEVMAWVPGPKGLLLYGPSGRCKTRFAYALLGREFHAGKKKVGAITHPELRQKLSALAYSNGRELIRFIHWLAKLDILLLDDLGKGQVTPTSEEGLAEIIDQRYRHERPVIYTTNDGPDVLEKRLSESRGVPILRRIIDSVTPIEFQ